MAGMMGQQPISNQQDDVGILPCSGKHQFNKAETSPTLMKASSPATASRRKDRPPNAHLTPRSSTPSVQLINTKSHNHTQPDPLARPDL